MRRIAVVLPSRGLVFTRVLEAIEAERQDQNLCIFATYDRPIPLGHEEATKRALDWGAEYIWYIEEDTVPPPGALRKLLEAQADVACIDYGVAGWSCVARNAQGEVLWCGLGCTLVKAEVFAKLKEPYFRTDKLLRLNDWQWIDVGPEYALKKGYGGLDIWFFCQVRGSGFTIKVVEGECDHLELVGLGQKGTNSGLHEIRLKARISKRQIL